MSDVSPTVPVDVDVEQRHARWRFEEVLSVADQIAVSGSPNVLIKIQTSEDLFNWTTPVTGSPNQNELQLSANAPEHGESGSPAGTPFTVSAQSIRLEYTMSALAATALVSAGIEISRE